MKLVEQVTLFKLRYFKTHIIIQYVLKNGKFPSSNRRAGPGEEEREAKGCAQTRPWSPARRREKKPQRERESGLGIENSERKEERM